MKKQATSTCGRPTFKDLDRKVYDFANEVRQAIKKAIDAYVNRTIEDDDAKLVCVWGIALGALIYDVISSILLLLSHGHRRAPALLNRCVFDYQIRLRYYILKADKAREAMAQLPERFKRIMRADPTWHSDAERTEENIAETEEWLSAKDAIARENFKEEVLKTVLGANKYVAHYDAFYE